MAEELDQLQKEWLVINAGRELLSLAKGKGLANYDDSIKLVQENSPALFKESKTGLVKRTRIQKIRDNYEIEARFKSIKFKKAIRLESLIEERINELEDLIEYSKEDLDQSYLKRQIADLKKAANNKESEMISFERVTENQAINNDSFKLRNGKKFINSHLGKFNEYQDRNSKNIFRVTMLHPNPSEAIVGADLIYEQYNNEKSMVRIAAIQYKIWDQKVFYFSSSPNFAKQLEKLEKCFCKSCFCKSNIDFDNNVYRLPCCAAFFRPTDKLQSINRMITSGYHIPICDIEKVVENTNNGYKIEEKKVKAIAISTDTFEELFNLGKIGSDWIDVRELETFYQESKILEANQKIVLYAQIIK